MKFNKNTLMIIAGAIFTGWMAFSDGKAQQDQQEENEKIKERLDALEKKGE